MTTPGTCSSTLARGHETFHVGPPIADSRLGGITFNNQFGRYVSLYWQDETGRIVESTYHQHEYDQWSLATVKAVTSSTAALNHRPGMPKLCTPLTVVSLKDGLKVTDGRQRWLFYLDEGNVIHELTTEDGGQTWKSGTLQDRKVITTQNSCLNATVDHYAAKCPNIMIYYQNDQQQIERMIFDGGQQWVPGNGPGDKRPITFIAGTSIATLTRQNQWVFALDPHNGILEFFYSPSLYSTRDIPGTYHPSSTISACGSITSGQPHHVFVHTETSVKVIRWEAGNYTIVGEKKNLGKHFIALDWDMCNPKKSDIHLFSHIPAMRGYVLDTVWGRDGFPQGPLPLRFDCS